MKYEEITPRRGAFELNFKEIWHYKDLLILFVRRDFVAVYKQTILGPLWFFIQPLFTSLMFSIIFGRLANIPTDGIPPFLFYLCGITCWNYFSESLVKTSSTFTNNAGIFGKVYFPRLVLPISVVMSNLLKLGVQFLLFLSVMAYYVFFKDVEITITYYALLFPVLIGMMACLGLGLGLIISSMTTKYRDLKFLVVFGVQLFMYATPVVYPISLAHEKLGDYAWVVNLNPMAPIIETMKLGFLGNGVFSMNSFLFCIATVMVVLFLGIFSFNKVEKSFMDTV